MERQAVYNKLTLSAGPIADALHRATEQLALGRHSPFEVKREHGETGRDRETPFGRSILATRLDLEPFASEATSEELAEALDFRLHPKKPGSPSVLYVSPHVNELFRRLLHDEGCFAGFLMEARDLQQLKEGLAKLLASPRLSGVGAQKVFALSRAISEGASTDGYLSVVGHGPRSILRDVVREEMAHYATLQLFHDPRGASLKLNDFVSDEACNKAMVHIFNSGYLDPEKGDVFATVLELVAKVGISGQLKWLGPTGAEVMEAAAHISSILHSVFGADAEQVTKWWERSIRREADDYNYNRAERKTQDAGDTRRQGVDRQLRADEGGRSPTQRGPRYKSHSPEKRSLFDAGENREVAVRAGREVLKLLSPGART